MAVVLLASGEQDGLRVSTGSACWEVAEQQRQAILASFDPENGAAAELMAKNDSMAVLEAEIDRLYAALSVLPKKIRRLE